MKSSRGNKVIERRKKNKQQQQQQNKNKQQKEIGCDDRISQLPDDILTSIICRLTFREATATTVLSSRWRKLITHYPRLCFLPFDPHETLHDRYLQEIQTKNFRNYISRVNHMLDSYKGGPNLKEFRLHLPCLVGANIDRWFRFALSRSVEIIDINMVYFHYVTNECGSYDLPPLFSTLSLPGLKSLKRLSLSGISMDNKDLQSLISNFASLENLSIACSKGLSDVSIVGHSLIKLKQLDICDSRELRSIEVRNVTSLVSLRCCGAPCLEDLYLVNVPKLIGLSTCGEPVNDIFGILPRMQSCILDQLLHLKLSTTTDSDWSYILGRLTNLRHLELEVKMRYLIGCYGLDRLVPLIKSCPSLVKFEMKFSWDRFEKKHRKEKLSECIIRRFSTPNLRFLKKVRLSGYFGTESEFQFASYIIKHALALDELIVEPCDLIRQREATARARWQFPLITPTSVNLVII